MKHKRTISLVMLVFILFCLPVAAKIQIPNPSPSFYVYDETNTLSQSTKDHIINVNGELNHKTKAQVVVAVVNNLQDNNVEDYALELFREWGIGDKDQDNGVLLLLALKDRQVRIEVGYGLEGAIPDSRAGRILDNSVLPHFKNNDFEAGLMDGFTEIINAVLGEYDAEIDGFVPTKGSKPLRGLELILVMIIGSFQLYIIYTLVSTVLRFIRDTIKYGPIVALIKEAERTKHRGWSVSSGGRSGGRSSGGGGRSGGGGASRGF